MQRLLVLALGAVVGLSCAACGGGPTEPGDPDAITRNDIFNVDDLLTDDADDTAAALALGDAPDLLRETRAQVRAATAHIRAALSKIKDTIAEREPDKTIEIRDKKVGIWIHTTDAGIEIRFVVARIDDTHVRYLLAAKGTASGDTYKGLLTGVFVRKVDRGGGGRLHINLTNISDLFGAPERDGMVHVLFANSDAGAIGRRAIYRNVTNRTVTDPPTWNFGVDLIRKPGVGGRARAILVGEQLLPALTGVEAFAVRARWKHGEGGRADAVLAHVYPPPIEVLAHRHQCWDNNGLLTAAKEVLVNGTWTQATDLADTTVLTDCGGFEQDADIAAGNIDSIADLGGQDTDPELDTLLQTDGADTILETDANKEFDASGEL